MKKLFILLLCSALFQTHMFAQNADEQSVAANTASLRKGLMEKNKVLLDQITSASLSYGHSSGLVEDKTKFIDAILNGPVSFAAIDISEQTIQIEGNIAVVRHIWNAKLIDNGNPRDLRIGVMLIWQKEKKDWKLLARQAFKF